MVRNPSTGIKEPTSVIGPNLYFGEKKKLIKYQAEKAKDTKDKYKTETKAIGATIGPILSLRKTTEKGMYDERGYIKGQRIYDSRISELMSFYPNPSSGAEVILSETLTKNIKQYEDTTADGKVFIAGPLANDISVRGLPGKGIVYRLDGKEPIILNDNSAMIGQSEVVKYIDDAKLRDTYKINKAQDGRYYVNVVINGKTYKAIVSEKEGDTLVVEPRLVGSEYPAVIKLGSKALEQSKIDLDGIGSIFVKSIGRINLDTKEIESLINAGKFFAVEVKLNGKEVRDLTDKPVYRYEFRNFTKNGKQIEKADWMPGRAGFALLDNLSKNKFLVKVNGATRFFSEKELIREHNNGNINLSAELIDNQYIIKAGGTPIQIPVSLIQRELSFINGENDVIGIIYGLSEDRIFQPLYKEDLKQYITNRGIPSIELDHIAVPEEGFPYVNKEGNVSYCPDSNKFEKDWRPAYTQRVTGITGLDGKPAVLMLNLQGNEFIPTLLKEVYLIVPQDKEQKAYFVGELSPEFFRNGNRVSRINKNGFDLEQYYYLPKSLNGKEYLGMVVPAEQVNEISFNAINEKYSKRLSIQDVKPIYYIDEKYNRTEILYGYSIDTDNTIFEHKNSNWRIIDEFDSGYNFVVGRAIDEDGFERAKISVLPGGGFAIDVIEYQKGSVSKILTYSADKVSINEYKLRVLLSKFTVLDEEECKAFLSEFDRIKNSNPNSTEQNLIKFRSLFAAGLEKINKEVGELDIYAGLLEKENDGSFWVYRVRNDPLARVIAQKNVDNAWQFNYAWDNKGFPKQSIKVWDQQLSRGEFKQHVMSSLNSSEATLREILENDNA